jgi:hypothetical protein
MRAVAVLVIGADPKRGFEMSTGEREHPVKALAAHRAHESLGDRVRLGCQDRRANHPQALGVKDLIEGGAELGVACALRGPSGLVWQIGLAHDADELAVDRWERHTGETADRQGAGQIGATA